MTTQTTDRIEKQIVLDAPRSRVWRALTDSKEFGEWFRMSLEGPFVAGKSVKGRVLHKGYEHMNVEFAVERVEPEHTFTYRWHPYPMDPNYDYSKDPMTLIEFSLEEQKGGTLLRVTESGFDSIPLARRAEALKMHDGGWTGQLKNIERWLAEKA